MSKIKCSHCHLEFDEEVMIHENEEFFCCTGCQGVFHLLNASGLDTFYDKLGDKKLSAPTHSFEDSSSFDSPSFYKQFVTVNEDGFSEVSLVIEGIHCSACVWLNERALHQLEGVIEASINYTNNKARIIWADHIVKLSAIIDMIRAVGYNAYAYDPSVQESRANAQRKEYYLRLVVAIFGSMNIMWIAIAQYAGYFTGMTQQMKNILNTGEFLLATPVLFYSGFVFFRGAYYGIKNHIVNMDLLVATGALLTYFYSIYISLSQEGEAYFDSVVMIITFVLVGKFLEVLSKKSAADTLDVILKHIPNEVSRLGKDGFECINVHEVNVGDTLEIKPGEKAALDGIITQGSGYFDESSLTGESHPIYKEAGDKLISGTICVDTRFEYRVEKDFSHSTLSNLVSMLENAMRKKPRIEMLANQISGHFSSVILLLALLTFIAWWTWPHSFEESFMVGISVVIIACPCALALATPLATLIGLSFGAKKGVLFKEAAQLETMAKTQMLILDKTGTITEGKPRVIQERLFDTDQKRLILALCESSLHPVAQGISRHIKDEDINIRPVALTAFKQVPSRGIMAEYEGNKLLGGNAAFMKENGIEIEVESDFSLFFFAVENTLVAYYELRDRPKEGIHELVALCKQRDIEVVMLTGDHARPAELIAKEVGIEHFYAGLSAEEKAKFVEEHMNKVRIMVGDGVNDTLALAHADIAIAMGSGSDIAIEVSDVVLLNDSLLSLKDAFEISAKTYRLVKQNLGISLLYNAITIPLAMAGYIIPLIAAASMSFSSLLVVGNSLRIKYKG